MNLVMNEYLHVNVTTNADSTINRLFKTIYEPPEKQPIDGLIGTIYKNTRRVARFFTRGRQVFVEPQQGNNPIALDGYYLEEEAVLMLYWDGDPGEHFLTVSYEFEEQAPVAVEPISKTNWLMEGF